MGSLVSCARWTEVTSPDLIRVVYLDGNVDEFPMPVSAKRVLQNHPHHFICNSHDLYGSSSPPLKPEEELRLGGLYFLLPLSALESAENLVSLARRLFAATKKKPSRAAQLRSADASCDLPGEGGSSMYEKLLLKSGDPVVQMAFREQLISKNRSWRPCLHTIHETDFAC